MSRLRVDLEAQQVGSADLVIEAIVEKADAKRALFEQLEPKLRDDALIATNTSSIALESLASALKRPARFVGLHFFNPVASLPLVEVIHGAETSEQAREAALSFVTRPDAASSRSASRNASVVRPVAAWRSLRNEAPCSRRARRTSAAPTAGCRSPRPGYR